MKRATFNGWLLETAPPRRMSHGDHQDMRFLAWVSDPQFYLVGYGSSPSSEADAVRLALVDAAHHYRKDDDALTGLETEYFGPQGMLATSACANGGQ